MNIVVKQNGSIIKKFNFSKGPIYIGRHTHSQIFFPDNSVSRQHAVIFTTQKGKWVVEDLDSANKTYLNGTAIHKSHIKNGDSISIADYCLEVDFEESVDIEKPINLEDTLTTGYRYTQTIVRKMETKSGPSLKMPPSRVKDYLEASENLCKANTHEELLMAMTTVALRQLSANRVWGAIRQSPEGSMTLHTGKNLDGTKVELEDIPLQNHINQAVEKNRFLLLPRVDPEIEKKFRICSAMIAPLAGPGGSYGVIYMDNMLGREHYTTSDLDYLIFLAIHAGSTIACG